MPHIVTGALSSLGSGLSAPSALNPLSIHWCPYSSDCTRLHRTLLTHAHIQGNAWRCIETTKCGAELLQGLHAKCRSVQSLSSFGKLLFSDEMAWELPAYETQHLAFLYLTGMRSLCRSDTQLVCSGGRAKPSRPRKAWGGEAPATNLLVVYALMVLILGYMWTPEAEPPHFY